MNNLQDDRRNEQIESEVTTRSDDVSKIDGIQHNDNHHLRVETCKQAHRIYSYLLLLFYVLASVLCVIQLQFGLSQGRYLCVSGANQSIEGSFPWFLLGNIVAAFILWVSVRKRITTRAHMLIQLPRAFYFSLANSAVIIVLTLPDGLSQKIPKLIGMWLLIILIAHAWKAFIVISQKTNDDARDSDQNNLS